MPMINNEEELDLALKDVSDVNRLFNESKDSRLAGYQSDINGAAGLIKIFRTSLFKKATTEDDKAQLRGMLVKNIEQLGEKLEKFSLENPDTAKSTCAQACERLKAVVKANKI